MTAEPPAALTAAVDAAMQRVRPGPFCDRDCQCPDARTARAEAAIAAVRKWDAEQPDPQFEEDEPTPGLGACGICGAPAVQVKKRRGRPLQHRCSDCLPIL